MYFYLNKGKQVLDLKGDLILSFNDELVKARIKSAGPVTIKAPDGYILNIGKLSFINRIRLTCKVIGFIWGKDQALKREDTDYRESRRVGDLNTELKAVPTSNPENLITDKSANSRLSNCVRHGGMGYKAYCIECTKKAI